jgi:hypothetical protein
MSLSRKSPLLALVLSTVISGAVSAQEERPFTGFGTIGVVLTDTDAAEFVSSIRQPTGAKKTEDYKVDSNIGLKGVARFGQAFSGSLMVLARRDEDDKFSADVERAFFSYGYDNKEALRLGRISLPALLIVEDRDRNFAHPGVRLPVEVYGAFPVSRVDGADITYTEKLPFGTFAASILAGKYKLLLPPEQRNTEVEGTFIFGGTMGLQYGSFTVRGAVFRTKVSVDTTTSAAVLAALRQLIPLDAAQVNKLIGQVEVKDDISTFGSIGASFDNGRFLARAEFAKVATDGDNFWNYNSSYATLAVRLGKFQPSATYSVIKPDVVTPVTTSSIPAVPALATYFNTFKVSQNTTSFALRYDWTKNVAAKFQYDKISADKVANLLVNRTAAFDGAATVYSLSLDVSF